MEQTQAISYYLQHLAVLIGRQSDQVLQEQLGIGMSQYRILQALQANPSIQQKQIASLLGQTEASISRQVKLMIARSMISAEANPENRREHIAVILPKGERLLEAGAQALANYLEPAFASLSGRERGKLLELLSELHSSMCAVDGLEGLMHVGAAGSGKTDSHIG